MAEQAKEFTGLWVPKEILQHPTLLPSEKLILAEIVALAKGNACTASNQYISDVVGVGIEQTRKIIYKLTKVGLLRSKLYRGEDTKLVTRRELYPMVLQYHTLCDCSTIPPGTTVPPPMVSEHHTYGTTVPPLCDYTTTPYGTTVPIENIDKSIVKNIEERIEETTTTPATELITFWESNLGILTPFMLQQINSIIDDHGVAWTRKAMEETAGAGVEKPFPYFKGIVRNWEASKKPEPWTKVTPIKREQTATERAYAIREQARKLIAESEEEENDAM